MSQIFISYAREDQSRVASLVAALEAGGLTVFWDRRIPTGQTWHSFIGRALSDATCVLVVWSKASVASNWVIEEAGEARGRGVLVPICIDAVEPPLGFRSVQAADFTRWKPEDGTDAISNLIRDIEIVAGSQLRAKFPQAAVAPPVDPVEAPPRSASPSKGGLARAAIAVLIFAAIGLGGTYAYLAMTARDAPRAADSAARSATTDAPVMVDIYTHRVGLTAEDAESIKKELEARGMQARVLAHVDQSMPDAIFIGSRVGANEGRAAIELTPYRIKYIFRQDYSAAEGGDPSGYSVGIGYMSNHYAEYRGIRSEPIPVTVQQVQSLIERGLSNDEFQKRLREILKR